MHFSRNSFKFPLRCNALFLLKNINKNDILKLLFYFASFKVFVLYRNYMSKMRNITQNKITGNLH